jgi:hypothetical protein|tara:strand:- start:125 stop:349 length:225 start_codon:yes stop_codon:yes gene_type:complete
MKGKMGCKTCGDVCESCKTTSWLAPLVIIGLIWFGPLVELWTKVVITLAALAVAGGMFCPCSNGDSKTGKKSKK